VALAHLTNSLFQDKDGDAFYPSVKEHIQNFAYLVVDPFKRHAIVLFHQFGGSVFFWSCVQIFFTDFWHTPFYGDLISCLWFILCRRLRLFVKLSKCATNLFDAKHVRKEEENKF